MDRGTAGWLVAALLASLPVWLVWFSFAVSGGMMSWMIVSLVLTGSAVLLGVQGLCAGWVAMKVGRDSPWGWLAVGWLLATALVFVVGVLRMWTTG